MRITSKGQVTIPIEMRRAAGLLPGTDVAFLMDGDSVRIVKVAEGTGRGARIVEHLRGRGSVRMTTDEILALTRSKR